jgi:uracil-DNA glycosylase family 4
MERSPAEEARAVIASARQLLEDFVEEGVHSFERAAPAGAATTEAAESTRPKRREIKREPIRSTASPEPRSASTAKAAEAKAPAEHAGEITWSAQPTLEEVRNALGECTRCGLAEGRNQLVFGDGNPTADLMFIGEGPGQEEDRRGLPFVGKAGELLTQMIEKGLGIQRSDVYICNIVKCRPPNNRTPLEREVTTCSPFLDGQIAAVKPKVIVALGKPATSLLLGREVAITRIRGGWFEYRGIPLMPTLHPAYILRQYTPENRRLVWEDLKAALAKSRE